MADSGGHWDTLAEAQKLTQAVLVPGVIEEDIRRGGPMQFMPTWQLNGLELQYLRENGQQTAVKGAIGGATIWQDAVTYTKITRDLNIATISTPLDRFVAQTYGGINNYEAIQFIENQKAIVNHINDKIFYGDRTYGAGENEPDGLHALAQAYPTPLNGDTNGLDLDAAGALPISKMRQIARNMKYGIDVWFFPHIIADRVDAYFQEAGIASFAGPGVFNQTIDQFGQQVMGFQGVPIVRTDYLVEETNGTGEGTNIRAKSTSGNNYTAFAVKFGQPAMRQPGVGMIFGGEGLDAGQITFTEKFEKLEDQIASGLRMTSFYGIADGSAMAIGRIRDITDAAIIA